MGNCTDNLLPDYHFRCKAGSNEQVNNQKQNNMNLSELTKEEKKVAVAVLRDFGNENYLIITGVLVLLNLISIVPLIYVFSIYVTIQDSIFDC